MYESFYGLNAKPFQLRPDPHFFYGSKGHKRAMAYLEYGLSQGEGFIVSQVRLAQARPRWCVICSANWNRRKSSPHKS